MKLHQALVRKRHTFVEDGWMITANNYRVGDQTDIHQHDDPATVHLTIVLSGKHEVLGERAGRVLRPGDVIVWKLGEPNGLRTIADGIFYHIRPSLPGEDVNDGAKAVVPSWGTQIEHRSSARFQAPCGCIEASRVVDRHIVVDKADDEIGVTHPPPSPPKAT
jgi:quercetin dioxygenase-like cupin family protein